MDDEHMTSAENEQSQSQSQSQNKRKARGASKGLKSKTGVVRVLEWDQYYRPVGKWASDFKTHIGEIARAKVSISYKLWKDVPQGIKDTLWEDCKREFHIEEHEQKKRRVLRTADERWRGFKQRLVSGWITCTRKMPADKRPPYELYDFMDVDVWNRFVEEHSTDEFQAISERARKNQSFNEYPHHMGAKSYAEMDAVLKRKGLLPSSSSTSSSASSVVSSLPDRTAAWLLARSKEDEKGNPYLPDEKTKEAKKSIDEWKKNQEEGKFVPTRHDDVLARALGRKDRYGRALGFGQSVGIRNVWGSGERDRGRHGSQIEMEELEARVDAMVQQKFMALVKQMGIQIPSNFQELNTIGQQTTPQNISSCHSCGGDGGDAAQDPFPNLKEPTPCKLSVMINSEKVIVADGTVYPELVIDHHSALLPDHVSVSVDDYDDEFQEAPVPVPSQFIKKLKNASGTFTQWPKHFVSLLHVKEIIPEKADDRFEIIPNVQAKRKEVDSGHHATKESNTNKKKTFLTEFVLENLSERCKVLKDLLTSTPEAQDLIILSNESIFSYENLEDKRDIRVFPDDIEQLLSGKWLNVSILQVFIMALSDYFLEEAEPIRTGFMCPEMISETFLQSDANRILLYMRHAMEKQRNKHFILCPYYEKDHWVLLVLCMAKREVYVFDSIRRKRHLLIKPLMINAFRTYKTLGGKSRGIKLSWTSGTCPQQVGGDACGYYVMRYMFEIMRDHHSSEDLITDFSRSTPYSIEEINEVRDLWADYFVSNVELR